MSDSGGEKPFASSNLKKIKISFYDPFSVFPKLQKDLESKLPLTNLHWKASDKSPLRSIPCLDVELCEEIPKTTKGTSLVKTIDEQMLKRVSSGESMLKRASTVVLEGSQDDAKASTVDGAVSDEYNEAALMDLVSSINDSYLKVMFFEAQNIEHYKQNVRPFIKEWFKQSVDSSKLPTDWLLVFYISQGGKDDYTTAFKYGLLDKIKLDFNNYKNGSFLDDTAPATSNNGINSTNGLKILKIKHDYANTTEYSQAWNLLLLSIKTGVLNTFTERINFFEYKLAKFLDTFASTNEVKLQSKNGPVISKVENGPNFNTQMNIGLYFLMNENLGILYHDLSLYEDSLIQYDNLEKIFDFYLRKHSDSNLDIQFLNQVGFEANLEHNLFYFNIYKSLQDNAFKEGTEPGLTVSAYEQIAPKIFKSLTNFNNAIFTQLRKKILSNEISYFELKNYFFLKQVALINSIIFNNFSQLSSTPSVNSVYIYDLLKRLKSFVIEINFEILHFKTKENHSFLKLVEYCFTMIDNYLLFINEYFFKAPQKVQNNDSDLPPLGNKAFLVYSKSKEINDAIGELRLIQRFLLVLLGKIYGYHLDIVFIDTLVDSKFTQCSKAISKQEYQFDHPLLTRIFSSFDNFAKYFKYLTESAISNFNISDKPRNVDILSIDIALLNYQVENYSESLIVLLNCPNFYNEQGWEYIGFYLLKVFVSCLEKVLDKDVALLEEIKDDEEMTKQKKTIDSHKVLLFKSYLDLLSTLIDSSNPAASKMTEVSLYESNSNFVNNNLENINKHLTDTEQLNSVVKQMLKLREEVQIEYDLGRIFKYKIYPHVISDEDNTYSIELELDNLLLCSHDKSQGSLIFDFDKIELVLQNLVNKEELVTFNLDKSTEESKDKFFFKKGKNKILLSTRHIIAGRFVPKELKLYFGGVCLSKTFITTKETPVEPEIEDSTAYNEETYYEIKDIFLIHPYINGLHFELCNPLKLNLNYKQFLVKINVGNFEVDNGVLEFSCASNAFLLIGNDLKAILKNRIPKFPETNEFDFDDDSLFDEKSISEVEITSESNSDSLKDDQSIIFKIGKLSKNSIVDVIIPYTMSDQKYNGSSSENKNLINLKTKITYFSNNKKYSLISYQDLDTALSIAVSVQDTFKSHNLFSKFSVGTSNLNSPIRILATDLLPNQNYNTSTALLPPALVAFGEQPASYFYKIEPVDKTYITKSNDSLKLIVHYRNLSEEIFESVWKYFKETYLLNRSNDTQKNHIHKYILVLKDYLFKLLRFDLNEYAVFNKIKIKHFNIFEFSELFLHFFPEDRSKYLDIFKKFIDSLKKGVLDLSIENFKYINSIDRYGNDDVKAKEDEINAYFSNISRELFINVPIPLVQVVHNVSLDFEHKSQYVVGEPITAKFKIQSLVNWRGEEPSSEPASLSAAAAAAAASTASTENSPSNVKKGLVSAPKKKRVLFKDPNEDSLTESFQLDFVGPQENWLISGRKKFQFSINKEGNEKGSTAIEQPESELYLVPLKIGKLILPKVEIKTINNHLNDEFTMEVDYKNSSQTVLVVPNLDRVTFAF